DPGDSPGAIAVGAFAVEDTPDALLWDTGAATFRHYRSEFTGGVKFMGELSWTTLCPDCGAPPSVVRLWTGHMDSGGVADLIIGTNDYLVVALNPLSESPRWETFSTRAIRAIVADFNNDGLDDLVVEVATNEPCILLLSDP